MTAVLIPADVRFPLERANGIQTVETCHALAVRGHIVRMSASNAQSCSSCAAYRARSSGR